MASVGLEILDGLRAQPAKEKRVVLRQPRCPQVLYEVDRVIVVVVYPLSTNRDNYSVSYNIKIELNNYRNTTYIH